jgi:hypothetical protein
MQLEKTALLLLHSRFEIKMQSEKHVEKEKKGFSIRIMNQKCR